MIRASRSVPLLAALLGAGCYTYAPAPLSPRSPLAPDTPVRAELFPQGEAEMRALLGPYASRIEGTVREQDDSTVTLAVTEVTRASGVPERWNGESVRFARRDLAQLSVRSFSAQRTTLVSALTAGAALLAARAFSGGGDGATAVIAPPSPGH